MRRLPVLVLILSLLFQGMSAAWASMPLARPIAVHAHAPMRAHATAQDAAMPCHHHHAAAPAVQADSGHAATTHDCCRTGCHCPHACSSIAVTLPTALPVHHADARDALAGMPAAQPLADAHTHSLLRPPTVSA